MRRLFLYFKIFELAKNMNKKSLIFGVLITFAWLLGIYLFSRSNGYTLPTSLNELGDFLAGIFAPIAFFWLILGYIQQGKQLADTQKHLARELEARRFSVEPILSIVDTKYLTKDLDPKVKNDSSLVSMDQIQLTLRNDGDHAKNIKIIRSNSDPESIYQYAKIIRHGSEAEFYIELNQKERIGLKKLCGNTQVNIALCYADQYGESYQISYLITIYKNEKDEFVVDKPLQFKN
jgi:hypothetical protein